MKKMYLYIMVIFLITAGFPAYAELPNPNSPRVGQPPPFGQGMGNGASFYSPHQQPMIYGGGQTAAGQAISTGSDLLWLFTGNEAPLGDQVKSGFKSGGQTTFGNRVFSLFLGAVFGRVLNPIGNRLVGSVENSIGTLGARAMPMQTAQNPYMNPGAQACYNCTQQNNTNPYAQNQNAINPAIFNSSSSSAGGIKK